jgi:hypothetical protein
VVDERDGARFVHDGRVKRLPDEPGTPWTKPSWRKEDWNALVSTLLAGVWIYVTLTYLWNTASAARLSNLILFSVLFGVGLGQLPPVRGLLRGRRTRGHEDTR